MSNRDVKLLLDDMLQSAKKIKAYTDGFDINDFVSDDKTIDAVIRNFEVIGEASIRIDDEFKLIHPEIEWKRLRGFRNRIVHEYFGIDFEIVWEIIENYLDELISSISTLLNEY